MNLSDASEANLDRQQRLEHLDKLSRQVVGLDVQYPLATGASSRRIYLDSTASTLRLEVVQNVLDRYQPYYANTHSLVHFSAKVSTEEYQWAHDMMLDFVRADRERYTSFFVGSGTTGGMNRIARTLAARSPERDVVVTSTMEHHSNDLPHRQSFREVVHVPTGSDGTTAGTINLDGLRRALEAHRGRVAYVAMTGVSNVTGIINPIHEIAEIAHANDTLIVVDGAQMVAHVPVRMSGNADPARDIDVLAFSGHKIYAPGSPGVVVARKDLFAGGVPQEVGGGMVDGVWLDRFEPTRRFPDREEAGTPNIPGAIGLAAALYALDKVGMDLIFREECELVHYALEKLRGIDGLVIYGETDDCRCQRAGAVSFNIRGVHHALTAAVLNDYFNIAVRNECFCAHPYVREMITEVLAGEMDDKMSNEELEALAELQRGMVRASFGLYTTRADVDGLAGAVRDISDRRDHYAALYEQVSAGEFRHKSFRFDHARLFSVRGAVDDWLSRA